MMLSLVLMILAIFATNCSGNRMENEVNKQKVNDDHLFQMVSSIRDQMVALEGEVTYIRRKTKHIYETLKKSGTDKCITSDSSSGEDVVIRESGSRNCPLDFSLRRRNSCYHVISKKVTWLKAREECLGMNAHLVAIETEGEHKFIMNHINTDQTIQHCDFWTGGTDVLNEGHYVWNHTGEALAFNNWHTLEPNNGNGNEHCIMLDWYFNWKWNDATCDRQRACVICETRRS